MKQIQNAKISVFADTFTSSQTQITLSEYFENIQSGKWQDDVLQYRAGKRDKKKIPAVTASGFFVGRKDADLKEHSGLLVVDIDDKDQNIEVSQIREQIKEIPELLALHYSLGGKGLAAYFRIKRDKHYESYEAITKMLTNDYGIVCDMHCSNIGRLRFVSYDPDLYLNWNASQWLAVEKKSETILTQEQKYEHHIFSENDVDYIIQQIQSRQINIAPDYYSWLRIGFGLASKYGEAGRKYFNIISAMYDGKQSISPDKQYDRCLKSDMHKSSGASIKSFFYYAKLAGCDLTSERTRKISTIGKIRRKQEAAGGNGAPINGKADAAQYLKEFEAIEGKDVDDILQQIWKAPISELQSEEGLMFEVETFLKSNYKFKLNDITGVVEVDGTPIDDYLFNTIYLRCQRTVSEKANKDKIFDLIYSDFTPKYNPILEWFEKNKHIKTVGNIDKLAKCINSNLSGIDELFVRDFLEKWLLSIVGSAHGIYSILCLVLTGQVQGTGKTNFFRELLPDELRWLFAINKLDSNNEASIAMLMCSKLLILDDEFGGKSKQDEKRFKELISKDVFSVRRPWGRHFQDMRRLAVLCGTTNEEQVINDLTGNRRIIPIQTNHIDEHAYNNIDKRELLVEAYWKYRENPTSYFLNKADIERLNTVCYDSNQTAPEVEAALKYFKKCDRYAVSGKFLSTTMIRSYIEQRTGIRLSQQKLSIALKNIGYLHDRIMIDGCQNRGFWVSEREPNNGNIDNETPLVHESTPF